MSRMYCSRSLTRSSRSREPALMSGDALVWAGPAAEFVTSRERAGTSLGPLFLSFMPVAWPSRQPYQRRVRTGAGGPRLFADTHGDYDIRPLRAAGVPLKPTTVQTVSSDSWEVFMRHPVRAMLCALIIS